MATIVNTTPAAASESNSGLSFLLGAILLVILFILALSYGGQVLRGMRLGGTQINVPDKVDVNVNKTP